MGEAGELETDELKEVKPEVSAPRKKGREFDVDALKKSINGWAAREKPPEKPPEKVTPHSIKEATPPSVEDTPQDPYKRTREQGVAVFHKIQKEYQERQLELKKANIQGPSTPIREQPAAILHDSESQNKQNPPPTTERKNVFQRFLSRLSGKSWRRRFLLRHL